MVICKYFLQNRCAFGPRCRYEHQITYDNLCMADRAEIVKKLLLEWKMGRIWPLSKLYPFEDRSEFGDFENFSFEEVRYNFYNAKSNGTLNEHITQFTHLTNEVAMKIDCLINQPESMYPLISNMRKIDEDQIQTINSNSSGDRFDILKSNMASTISNPFPAPVFRATGNTISPFQASVPANTVSPFSAAAPVNSANSGFSFMQSAGGIFKQNSQNYQQSTSASPFNNPLNNQTAQLFNNNNSNNNTVFMNIAPTPPVLTETANLGIYSKIEDLTEVEMAAFNAEFFETGKIPVKPPPLNMC